MVIEGFKLMAIGMATVLLFLVLMIVLIKLVSYATKKITARELELIKFEKQQNASRIAKKKLADQKDTLPVDDIPVAVLAAAITAFESDKSRGQ